MREIIQTNNAPQAIGPYEQGIRCGNVIYTSGQIALNTDGIMVEGDVKVQTKQVLENLSAVLKATGADLTDIVKTTVFIKDMSTFQEVNEIYAQYFSTNKPARSCVEVSALPKGALVEIEAIAIID